MNIPNKIQTIAVALLATIATHPRVAPLMAQAPAANASATTTRVAVPTELTAEPYEIPSLSMSIYLPAEALVDLSRLEGGRTAVAIRPQTEKADWVIQIQNSISADRGLTAAQALDNIVEQRRAGRVGRSANRPETSLVRAFDRATDLVLGDLAAQRVYLDVPIDDSAPVSGYTIFQNGPGQFIILQLDCTAAVFPRIRPLYELMAATVQFKDPTEVGAQRAASLLAGKELLRRLASEDLSPWLDAEPIFYRIYRPALEAPQGADPAQARPEEEVGYQRIQLRKGFAGELSGKPSRNDWKDADKEPGYIAKVDARALNKGAVVDTISTYFLSESREQELWSLTMVVRSGKEREQWTEVGIRREQRLTVKTTQNGAEPTSTDYALPETYISRFESYLLPRAAAGMRLPGLFGFYSYESNLSKMSLRRDAFAQAADGTWNQSTALTENSRPIITSLGPTGRILLRATPDGQIMQPIEQEALRKIWADKKLPLE